MRLTLTALCLCLTFGALAQCNPAERDTIPLYFHLTDTCYYYDYYNKSGSLAWKQVKCYDPSLIPVGGWTVRGNPVPSIPQVVKGFGVFQTNVQCYMVLLTALDLNKRPITGKLIHPAILL